MSDPRPLDTLVHHAAALRALARDLLGDAALAEDAVQEAARIAVVAAPPHGNVAGWLRRVVASCALDLRRRERRRARRERLVARPVDAATADPAEVAERIEIQQDVLAAVRSLDEPGRTAVWLRYFEGLSPAQIAERTDERAQTVRMRLWRALDRLRSRLDERHGRGTWAVALAPLAAPGTPAMITAAAAAGALSMQMKKVVAAALVLTLVLVGGFWWPRSGAHEVPTRSHETETATAVLVEAPAPEPDARRTALAAPAPVERAPAEPFGSLRVQVRWHDGEPAANVAVTLRMDGEPQRDRGDARVVSDIDGVAYAARVAAGAVHLATDRGAGTATAQVEAGRESTVELRLPRGVDVRGTVTDAHERPVAGARIFVASGRGGWLAGRSVAITNADGTFLVRSVNPGLSVGALARGFAPSDLVDLETLPRAEGAVEMQIALRLLRAGAAIEGSVADADGQPVAGALVAIGHGGGQRWEGAAGVRESWSPDTVATDEDGAFRCDCVAPGVQPIAVRAEGFALWTGEVECPPGERRTVAVILQRGATVHGVVRDTDGNPVAGATVTALAQPDQWLVAGGETDFGQSFARPQTCSADDGSFALRDVSPGERHLLAIRRDRPFEPHRGMSRHQCSLLAGERIEWNPVLSLGNTIRVRVLDADGGPADGQVEVFAEQAAPGAEHRTGSLRPDRQGVVTVTDCASVPYTVQVRVPGGGWVWQCGAVPDGPEVVLRLPPARERWNATVRGAVADDGQRLVAGQRLFAFLFGPSGKTAPCPGGRFEFTRVDPGRYVLVLRCGEATVFAGEPFDVQDREVVDLGTIATKPGASLTVTLRAPTGVDLAKVRGMLDHGPPACMLAWNGTALHAQNLEPGRHRLTLHATGCFAPPRDIELAPGRETTLAIDVVPAPTRRFAIALPFPDQWTLADLRLVDAAGAIVAERLGLRVESLGLRPATWPVSLPPGRYTLHASTATGLERSWPLDLAGAPTAGDAPLPFSMR